MKVKTVKADLLNQGGRLDAKYYLSPGVQAMNVIAELKASGTKCVLLDDIAEIWAPKRFKSAYAALEEEKVPYIKPYDVFQYLPTATHHISTKRTKDIDVYRLEKGTILQTCSGRNLGPSTMVDEYLSEFIIGSDMIRIDIENVDLRFYTLAYLQSEIVQQLLKRGKTGSVIDHLSKKHIGKQEIPILDEEIKMKISQAMKRGFELREKARLTLRKLLDTYENSLPRPDKMKPAKNGWTTQSSKLTDRLDAAFYDPLVYKIRQALLAIGGITVKDVATVLKPKGRYKTVYVDSEYGKPILSGTQLLQEYPINLRYIAPRAFNDVSNYELHTTWIAYQADGRVERGLGVPAFITSERDGWLASGHIGRLVAKSGVNPGWLFLATNTWHTQIQIKSRASGSVVDSTFPEDMEDVILPPQKDVDGDLICDMWEQFVTAKDFEQRAIGLLEQEIDKLIK